MSDALDIRGKKLADVGAFSVPEIFRPDLEGIMISDGEIKDRAKSMAEEIERDYENLNMYAICMMNGALKFFSELMYEGMNLKFQVNSIKTKRYEKGTESNSRTTIYAKRLEECLGMDVLLVEDIIDEGFTLLDTIRLLKEKYTPKSIRIASLLDKPARRKTIEFYHDRIVEYTDETKTEIKDQVEIDGLYVGFTIDNKFVIGHGLDFDEQYRGFPHIAVLKEEVYKDSI